MTRSRSIASRSPAEEQGTPAPRRSRGWPGPARLLPGTAAMLLGAVVWSEPSAGAGTLVPKRLAIYYGIPSLVNGAQGDTARAAAVFAEYDLAVFGDGLEFPDVVPQRTPAGAGPVEHAQNSRDHPPAVGDAPGAHRLRLHRPRRVAEPLTAGDRAANRPLAADGGRRHLLRRSGLRLRRHPSASECGR